MADFVGRQGIGLKLLSVRKIVDRMRPGETAEGEPLSLDISLRDALSAMTTRRERPRPMTAAFASAVRREKSSEHTSRTGAPARLTSA